MSESLVRQFETFAANGGGKGPAWLRPLRERAIARFREVGFPTAKDEEWRFTPVGPIASTEFAVESPAGTAVRLADLGPYLFGETGWRRLVFVDGRYEPDLSITGDQQGVRIRPWSVALAEDPELLERNTAKHVEAEATAFTALNTAFMKEGAVIEVAPGVDAGEPIHLVFVATGAAAGVAIQPRNLIVVGAEARAQLVESYLTLAPESSYLTNAVTEVDVGANAWVEHGRIQRESEAAYHVAFTHIDQARDSHYRSFSLVMGGAIARHNLHARLNEPNAESLLYGLYVGRGKQLLDNHTAIFHDQPDCRSWEVYKGVLDDRAHGVFNGKIFVQPEAQKTDAKQTNRALLLSDQASVDTKPQLEIFADDVKCTHGAAVGQIDEAAFFYLQSRGIPRADARRLLTYAFAAEVLHEVASAPVRTALEQVVHERLAAVHGEEA
ncbi:MAG: Fe-S cluster assembly protein SufD [Gemmatimonadales bacterium]